MRLCLFLLGITVFTHNALSQLKVDFSANVTNNCVPVVINFKDATLGSPTQWKWDLGNGTVSTQQNPSIIYFNPGTYTIKLVATNATGTDSIVKINYITVYNKPIVNFSASPSSGCIPLIVQFKDSSSTASGTITSWLWDFGDGSSDSVKNPQHIYTAGNNFGVVLTVKNNFGCSQTLGKPKLINASGNINAKFSFNYINTCRPPTKVTFMNASSPTPLSYQWDFGNGKTSTQASPVFIYDSTGNYQVQLIATSAQGCADTIVQKISIGTVIPDFTFKNSCIGQITSFTNISSPAPTIVQWSFGDGSTDSIINTSHKYNLTGTYNVTMTTDFGSCKVNITKPVTISNKPSPAFTGAVDQCSVPVTVQFNNSPGATTYQWSFGDNTATAIGTNPSHIYLKAGNFDVTLIATNNGGCSDTLTLKKIINLGPPKITSIQNLPNIGCEGSTIKMSPVIISPETIAAYAWDFGDGSTSTNSTPQHVYINPGAYNVSLTVTTATGQCTNKFTSTATILAIPVAKFSQDNFDVCASQVIQFTDLSTVPVTSWLWSFGDSTISSKQNPSHKFVKTGKFVVTLTVSNNVCTSTPFQGAITLIHPPIADFKVTDSCSMPFIKRFTDASTGAVTRIWDFGDGATDDVNANPIHTYGSAGTYTVTLTVTNEGCKDTHTQTINVVDQHPSFTYTPVSPVFCKYSNLQFQATNFDPSVINAFYWDFGDKSTVPFSKANSVISHQYGSSGVFLPILITQDILGCKNTTAPGLVNLTVYGPKAAFSTDVAGTCIKTIVNFSDKSIPDGTNTIVNWIWDYGDGIIEPLPGPSFQHTYAAAGTFSVRLKVIDSYGCTDSIAGPKIIITQPQANFSISDSTRCTNNNITFTNLSTGLALVNSWDLGDGNTPSVKNPVNTYSKEGIYTVKLTITDQFGCTDSFTKSNLINITNPVASFDLTDTFASCPPLIVHPLNTSHNYPAGSDIWQFDDGNTSSLANPVHTFTNGGSYQISLVVQGYGQCYDSASKTVLLHGSSGKLSYPILAGCKPATVTISAVIKNSQYRTWDFGDGVVVTNTDSSVSHIYTGYGLYSPKLLLSDTSGCMVTVVNKDTIHVSGILAGFSTVQNIDCDSSYISFSDSSVAYFGSLTSYSWNFGDSSAVSILPNIKHPYLRSGNYQFAHTVESLEGCRDSISSNITVVVHSRPNLVITAVDSSCISSPVQFSVKDTSTIGSQISSWQWDFGDNDGTSTIQQPIYTFYKSGNFNIQVAGTNSDGCLGTAEHDMEVLPPPIIDIGLDTTLCLGQSITLNPKGADSYLWITQTSLSCNQCSNPIAHPLLTTRYFVTGTTTLGCQSTDSILVHVKLPFSLTLSLPDTLCMGGSVQLNASGGDAYQWSPAAGLSNSKIANPVANPSVTTTYNLVASDIENCFSDTGKLLISVFPMPSFKIIDSVITLVEGYSKPIQTEGSEDIVKWEWSPATGLDCSDCAQPVAQPNSNITYTANVYNGAGCMSTDHVTVNVFCTGANVFIPNTFSPNGNGMNERFYPRGIGLFDVPLFQIFNRNGLVIFEKHCMTPNAASDGWDGTYKGQPAPSGVYVYILSVTCKNNTVFNIKGNVTLIR